MYQRKLYCNHCLSSNQLVEPSKMHSSLCQMPARTQAQPNPFDEIQIHFSDEDDAGKKGGFSFGKKATREEQPEKSTKAKVEKEREAFLVDF